MPSMPNPAETLNLPWAAVAGKGQGSLVVGPVQRNATLATGGDAGRMRKVVGVVASSRDEGEAGVQAIEKPFRF